MALVASLLLCPLALLAKAHAVVIPAVILCYELILGDGGKLRRALLVVPSGMANAQKAGGTLRIQLGFA